MRFIGFFVLATIGCGGSVASSPTDASIEVLADEGVDTLVDTALPETVLPDTRPVDVGPTSCAMPNPLDPPTGCGPVEEGATPCSSTTNVSTCPMGNECMAPAPQTLPVLEHRMGRLRLWAPDALLALTPIAIDPNINPRCANFGAGSFNWLLRMDTSTNTLRTGSARASSDDVNYSFMNDFSADSSFCPGFVGPTTPMPLRAESTGMLLTGDDLVASPIAALNVAVFDSSGLPVVLPLREVRIKGKLTSPTCVGTWDRNYWCDGTTLGWKDGGSVVAKISAEDADRVPIKQAGCQSLCAILVNDATKTDGKVCKRGPDGKVLATGNACIGGEGCGNAWLFSATFSSYGVNITP